MGSSEYVRHFDIGDVLYYSEETYTGESFTSACVAESFDSSKTISVAGQGSKTFSNVLTMTCKIQAVTVTLGMVKQLQNHISTL